MKVRWSREIRCENVNDAEGNPAGGSVGGMGLSIVWQDGPVGGGPERSNPGQALLEDVVLAAVQRLRFFQASKFACRENAIALTHLETALLWLQKRTADREEREVEGTHTP